MNLSDAHDRDVNERDAKAATHRRHALTTAGRTAKGRLDRVHRVGAVVFGLGLWVFGILGLVNHRAAFSTSGGQVLGLTSNGLLSVISLVVGAVLIAGAVRGGRSASTITFAVGTGVRPPTNRTKPSRW